MLMDCSVSERQTRSISGSIPECREIQIGFESCEWHESLQRMYTRHAGLISFLGCFTISCKSRAASVVIKACTPMASRRQANVFPSINCATNKFPRACKSVAFRNSVNLSIVI